MIFNVVLQYSEALSVKLISWLQAILAVCCICSSSHFLRRPDLSWCFVFPSADHNHLHAALPVPAVMHDEDAGQKECPKTLEPEPIQLEAAMAGDQQTDRTADYEALDPVAVTWEPQQPPTSAGRLPYSTLPSRPRMLSILTEETSSS